MVPVGTEYEVWYNPSQTKEQFGAETLRVLKYEPNLFSESKRLFVSSMFLVYAPFLIFAIVFDRLGDIFRPRSNA